MKGMKKISMAVLAAAALMAASCVQNELTPDPATVELTISAGLESNGDTKTETDDAGKITWMSSDAISIWAGEQNCRFTISEGAGTNFAKFSGSVPEGEVLDAQGKMYGICPYDEDNNVSGGKIHAKVPAVQTAVAGSYDPDAFVSVARSEAPDGFLFKNVCSGVRFKVNAQDVKYVVLSAKSGEALAGDITVDFDEAGLPYVSDVQNPKSEIILTAGGEFFEAGQWYYITSLPVVMEQGLELIFSTDYTFATLSRDKTITLRRSVFGQFSKGDSEVEYVDADSYWNSNLGSYPDWYYYTGHDGVIMPENGGGKLSYHVSDLAVRDITKLDVSATNPRVNGPWEGDWWMFECGQAVAAGDERIVKLEARISAHAPRYWIMEFRDGDAWVPVSSRALETASLPDGRTIEYNVDMYPGGSSDDNNKILIGMMTYSALTARTQVRMRCLAATDAGTGDMLSTPTSCSTRLDCSLNGIHPFLGRPSDEDYVEDQIFTVTCSRVGEWNKSSRFGVSFLRDGSPLTYEPLDFKVLSVSQGNRARISGSASSRNCSEVFVMYPYMPEVLAYDIRRIDLDEVQDMMFGRASYDGTTSEVALVPAFGNLAVSFDMGGSLAQYAAMNIRSLGLTFTNAAGKSWIVSGNCRIDASFVSSDVPVVKMLSGVNTAGQNYASGQLLSDATMGLLVPPGSDINVDVEAQTYEGVRFNFHRSGLDFAAGAVTELVLDLQDGDSSETLEGFLPRPGSTVYGRITDQDGNPVAGALVSDCAEIAETDSDGWYEIASDKYWGDVYVILPSGYEAPSEGAFPKFYKKFEKDAGVLERTDFVLKKVGDQTRHRMSFLGDMHLAGNKQSDTTQFEVCIRDYVNSFVRKSPDNVPIYGQTLGDMTWDIYWMNRHYGFPEYVKTLNRLMGNERAKVFHCIGNHDHEWYGPYGYPVNDFPCEQTYRDNLGPNFYSYNIGMVHYVVLDDIYCTNPGSTNSTEGRQYTPWIIPDQLDWLEKDLAHVSMDTPVVICSHAQFYDAGGSGSLNGSNSRLISILGGRRTYLVSGHTHKLYNVDKLAQNNVFELNTGSLCATWWWVGYKYRGSDKQNPSFLQLAKDGSLAGYRVFDVNGTDIEWYYKSVDHDESVQFRTYDRNAIAMAVAGSNTTFKSNSASWAQQSNDNLVYIEVWDYDPAWTISVVEDGYDAPLTCSKVSMYDPLHLVAFQAPELSTNSSFRTSTTPNMFRVQAHSPNSTLHITVTDRFGRVYTKDMVRPEYFPNTPGEVEYYRTQYQY